MIEHQQFKTEFDVLGSETSLQVYFTVIDATRNRRPTSRKSILHRQIKQNKLITALSNLSVAFSLIDRVVKLQQLFTDN